MSKAGKLVTQSLTLLQKQAEENKHVLVARDFYFGGFPV
jgi:hypothetical protein